MKQYGNAFSMAGIFAACLMILVIVILAPTIVWGTTTNPSRHIGVYTSTGANTMAITVSPGDLCWIDSIRWHAPHAGETQNTGYLTVDVDSSHGSAYDVRLYNLAVGSIDDYVYLDQKILMEGGDSLLLGWANSAKITWGVEVSWVKE